MQISGLIPWVNIIGRKVSAESVNGVGGGGGGGGLGAFWDPRGGFKGQRTLTKFLHSNKHLDWLKIDLNVVEIITVQEYKHTKV